MKLYYSPGSCSLAVHILVEELGLECEKIRVSAADGSTRQPSFLKINPKGKVPALDLGDSVITETGAILTYLTQTHADKIYSDHTPLYLARTIEWFSWLATAVHAGPIAQVWRAERFSDNPDHFEAIKAKGKENLKNIFSEIENKLNGRTWAMGAHYSAVDAYLLVMFRWGNRIGLDMANSYPCWTEQAKAMLKREAVARALDAEGISIWG